MEQFEQLLTCCVCLDRYRIPKLLPCQHSFCMEPCMEGLIDYVRRQVKCPECRAEHRIPYQGVQAFPTNVTLQRFLELHIEITGELPDPTSGQIMERCNVCSEKAYCGLCAHCDKKICEDCKQAHMDILRREIVRINSQIRRGVTRLQESLSVVEKNMLSLQSNCVSVSDEVDELYRRLNKALKDRSDHLRSEIDRYLGSEYRNLTHLKENLEQEITNIQSNCDIADKFINEAVEWDDGELMDTKEIFLKTVDFIRNFEYENGDYNRRVRFSMATDPHQLVMNVSTFGDLNISHPPAGSVTSGGLLQPPSSGPGLMRSKSDHRLASQFRQQEEQYDNEPALGGRKFGERPPGRGATDRASDRYGRSGGGTEYGDYGGDHETESSRTGKSRFLRRRHGAGDDSDTDTGRNVRFNEKDKEKEREKVIDTEDASRGQLSGIIRLADSPRVMKRIQDQTREKKEKKEVQAAPVQKPKATTTPAKAPPASRQMSEDDEIARIKRQNKGAAATPSSSATTAPPVTTTTTASADSERPAVDRVSALKRYSGTGSDDENSRNTSSVRRTPPKPETSNAPSTRASGRAGSTESSSSEGSNTAAVTPTTNGTATAVRQRPTTATTNGTGESGSGTSTPERKAFQSRFLPNHQSSPTGSAATAAASAASKAKEPGSSSEEESTSDESESETEEEEKVKPTTTPSRTTASSLSSSSKPESPTLGSSRTTSRTESPVRRSRDETNTSRSSGYASPNSYSRSSNYDRDESPKYQPSSSSIRSRPTTDTSDRYGSTSSGYTSRFLNKSKSTAVVAPSLDDDLSNAEDSDSRHYVGGRSGLTNGSSGGLTGTVGVSAGSNAAAATAAGGRSRYLALKERRARLGRSRSSHNLGNDDDDLDDDPPLSPTTASPSAYLASRYGASSSIASPPSDLSRSRSSHALKSRESSPDRSGAGADKDGAALSSWARYLKNKYGNRTSSKDSPSSSGPGASSSTNHSSPSSSSASAASRRLSLGLPLRQANENNFSSDDDSKNVQGSPTSPTVAAVGMHQGGMSPRTNYLQKRRQLYQLGGRGSEPGCFTWPRGIAVGPDSSIVVADSSNHRVQVFDANGCFVREFGQYGSGEGEFDCLAGVAVNRIGQFIIADRYNHRIQVLDPSGRFLRSFGSQGSADGKFNYPWGLTTDALGFIYVCDKENHRVQVFQSDGTFVGKFGSMGSGEGQLEHPHYIAVSNTNRVIVSDSNNHRVQVFDVNGKVLNTFGSEGSEEGQFKFPRGVAVDDQGYICVADSGNNRIQIFHPDGSFLRAFGCWGSNDAEFKGLEGVAMMPNGNILVCDRENHRVQVF